jgi:hypothetical protein
VFVPFYVGRLRRKASERLIAIHAGLGSRSEAVEQALHEKIVVVRSALDDVAVKDVAVTEQPAERAALPGETSLPSSEGPATATPSCRCGAAVVLRHRKADGEAFRGCSAFPRCRQTRPIA